ncbi:MAG: hypothetical protein WAT71_10350 [Ignavibacteria bacterium]
MIKKNILIIFVDPGGGLVISEVAKRLAADSEYNLIIYCGNLSEVISENADLKYKIIGDMIGIDTAEEIIKTVSPDMILTSTGRGNTEQLFRNIAYRENIPSVVILDFWKDYRRRWLYADHDIPKLKDLICVMDDLTKKEMTNEDFPEKNIKVTGHPFLDKIFNNKRTLTEKINGNVLNILFLSQPLDIIGIDNYEIHPFRKLINAVSEYSEKSDIQINIKIKLHPSEKMSEDLSIILEEKKINKVTLIQTSNEIINELIEQADLIIGYNTIALFEARSMGKRAISLNLFPMNNSLRKAFEEAGIESSDANTESLIYLLDKEMQTHVSDNIFADGIENCIRVISDELKVKEKVN